MDVNNKTEVTLKKLGDNENKLYVRLTKGVEPSTRRKIVTEPYLDMTLVYYLKMGLTDEEFLMMDIKYETAKKWGIDFASLREIAMKNTFENNEPEIIRLGELLALYIDEDIDMDKQMYVITNKSRNFGATSLIYPGLLENIYERIGGDYYILPSSIHECIALRAGDDLKTEMLRALVRNINCTEVKPDQVLSDSVYIYRKAAGSLSIDNL